MTALPHLLSSSTDELRCQLKGVRAEPGSLVAFRDAPAFEMVMRLNQRHRGKLVAAVLTKNDASDELGCSPAVQRTKKERKCDVFGSANVSEEKRMVFVPEAYEVLLENEMQKWLDPFRGCGEANKRKRVRDDKNGYDTDDDGIMEDNLDDRMDYSSSSSS
ncbi:hypothetical protein DQ04_02291090 [Trypanosoma grayi]|uniref:hypothetical protein n=1 Tax=Trypanosoma grayi TaxID=71804 RepID=UPI0004F422D5|nr:hypothetical protein DQ04_02291090 [Trypanosoma grayi]KEG11779.1 hypothetical protein DQ04_02291090 [Trypanosoma grayi]